MITISQNRRFTNVNPPYRESSNRRRILRLPYCSSEVVLTRQYAATRSALFDAPSVVRFASFRMAYFTTPPHGLSTCFAQTPSPAAPLSSVRATASAFPRTPQPRQSPDGYSYINTGRLHGFRPVFHPARLFSATAPDQHIFHFATAYQSLHAFTAACPSARGFHVPLSNLRFVRGSHRRCSAQRFGERRRLRPRKRRGLRARRNRSRSTRGSQVSTCHRGMTCAFLRLLVRIFSCSFCFTCLS